MAALAAPGVAWSATFVVDRTDDNASAAAQACTASASDCSLRGAILKANATAGADTIQFSGNATYTLTIPGDDDAAAQGDLDVTDSLTITGNGAANTIIQAGTTASNGIDKVFGLNPTCAPNVHVTMTGVTVRFGRNTFAHTAAFEDTGGGIDFCGKGTGASSSSFELDNSTVTQNSTLINSGGDTGHYGGGINIDEVAPSTSTITLSNDTITNNMASTTGGGVNIFGDNEQVSITGGSISNNTTVGPNGFGASGGGANIRITNQNDGDGAAVPAVTIDGTTIDGNVAMGPGGGLSIPGSGNQNVTIKNATVSNNTSHNQVNFASFGGGIYSQQAAGRSTTLSSDTISGNHADDLGSAGAIGGGGGVHNDAGQVTINQGTVIQNNTAQVGGGLFNRTASATTTMTGGAIKNNSAKGNGGGVEADDGSSPPGSGSAGTITLTKVAITGNAADSDHTGGGDGGGILDHGAALTMNYDRIAGNSAATATTTGLDHISGTLTDITNNWWGCSGDPATTAGCDRVAGTSSAQNPRLVLTHAGAPATLVLGQSSSLQADFLHNSAGTAIPASNLDALLSVPITFGNAVKGALSNAQATIQSNGTATATFTAGATSAACGAGGADATVDSGTTTVAITVQCPDLTASLANNASGNAVVGQSWTWTTTVANGGNTSANFSSGQTVLSANLPNAAAISFGSPSSSNPNVSCTIDASKNLTCTTTAALSLAASGSFTVSFTATATSPATYAVPRAAGTCAVDPSGVVVESNESNNGCSNSVVVSKADTTTTISSDLPDPSVVGQSVAVGYSVSVTAPGAGTPTGNVTVSDGTDSCTGTVAVGQCTLTFRSPGAKSVTATYGGDAAFTASPASSPATSHTVNTAGTTTSISSDGPDPSVVAQAVTVTYGVAVNSPGAGAPTGNVTVSDGTDSCTGTVAAGQCSISFTSAGSKSLTATYSGDANFNGSTSASESHKVGVPTTTTILSDDPEPSVVGQPVSVKYTVTAASGTPTGNVTVSAGTDSCTGTVASGQCTINFTSAGEKSLTAVYGGDSTFGDSTSAPEPHTVNRANATTNITSDSPDPSTRGTAVIVHYQVTVNPPGAGTPSGNVTVSDGVDSCTGSVAARQCSISLSTVGSHTLTATFGGDGDINGSTSVGETHTVYPPAATLAHVFAARETNRTFRVSAKPQLPQISRKRPPFGTTFTYKLDTAATVRFDFTQPAMGRRVRGECVTKDNRNKNKPACTRMRGSLTFDGHTGVNTVRFKGWLSRTTKLTPGGYTLVITATTPGVGTTSQKLKFTIVR